jgi:molybdenum ABC transporter molybdate-binding protein
VTVRHLRDSLARPAALALAAVAIGFAHGSKIAADPAAQTTLIALAAANVTDPLDDIIGAFERDNPGVVVVPEYAGTQILETQAEQGAPFDIFVSADKQHIDALRKEGLVDDVRLLSEGHEVIVVPKDNPGGITSLRDLADKDVKLVLGTDAVPIGIYTRQIFAKASSAYGADFAARALGHAVSFETNVKQVLEKVSLGEADGGVVYFTDVSAKYKDSVKIIAIPSRFEVEAANYIAVAHGSKQRELARALLDAATGPGGQLIFRRHGYDPRR